ncbi:MAG: dTDP-glucose 4,6-dehydratase [Pseudomonadales bacterium]|nr:dTDP-glucose 4,6-dehydratase [Pseudomonadales bacterium]
MHKLLVTGGAGFIGCNFVHYWMANNPNDKVVVLDKLTYAGNRENLAQVEDNENFEFVQGDICDQALVEKLLQNNRLDTIVHFAAESHVDRSITGPDIFIETNVIGTHSLLKAARQVWLEEGLHKSDHRFHHVSTDEVYGSLGPNDPPFTETTAYAPNSPYSASKAASDHLVRAYHETYGLNTTVSNCSNNYGPYQHPEKLIPLVILNILHGRPIPVYGDGKNVRDWLYVEDHCRGIEAVLKKGCVGEVYNIGGGNEVANIDLVERICGLVDEKFWGDDELRERFLGAPAAKGKKSSSLISYVDDRLGHDRRYAIDAGKVFEELGVEARFTVDEGLEVTFDWYLRNGVWFI